MKFTVARSDFFHAVQAVLNVVSPRATLPIISNILLQLTGKELSLYATDLDTSIRTRLAISDGEDGAVALPAKKLAEIVRELPDDDIRFTAEGTKARMSCGKGKFGLTGMDSEDFPPFPEAASGQTLSLKQSLLSRMIHRTIYSTSRDETRPALQGVLWHLDNEKMIMVATDGHRLAKISEPMKVTGDASVELTAMDIIIPAKALNHLLRLFGEEDADVKMDIMENQVIFSLDGTILYSRLIEGPYPDYEQVIPKDNDKRLRVDREILYGSMRSVSTLSNALTHQVKFDLSTDHIILTASDRDLGGEAKMELEKKQAQYQGDHLQIGYNANYIMEIMRHIDSPEVILELSTPVRAGLVKPSEQPEGEEYLCLIMPLRLTDESSE
jgi:DNA polymerase-3 subunit beta